MAKKSGRGSLVIAGLSFGLAGGLAAGTYILAPNLAGGSTQQNHELSAEVTQAQQEAEIATAQAASADGFIETIADQAVAGTLKERPVLVLAASDAKDEDVTAVQQLLHKAGAVDSGTIHLEEKFFSPEGADGLKNIVATTLPAGAQLSVDKLDSGTHAGESLGSALLLNPENAQPQASTEERAIVLGALREAGFINYQDGTILPAQAVVLILGDDDGANDQLAVDNQISFARALDSRGNGVVVAGRIQTAADTGTIGKLRAHANARQAVSTVDSVSRNWGRIATVLAVKEQLENGAGAYGSAASAEAASPAPRAINATPEQPPAQE